MANQQQHQKREDSKGLLGDEIERILKSYTGPDLKKLLGVAFIALDKDRVIYEGSAGHTDFAEGSPDYTTDTFTWIASLTKLITSVSLMQLVERGSITLDEDIRPRLPELAKLQILQGFDDKDKPILEANSSPITPRNLLSHTAGLGYVFPGEPELMKWANATDRMDVFNSSMDLESIQAPLLYPPGQGWRYSTATDWAGQLLEQVTGNALSEYMATHIFGPLGMESTTFRPQSERRDLSAGSRAAAAAYRSGTDGSLAPSEQPLFDRDPSFDKGGSGLHSTAADYARFLQALLAGRLLGPEAMDALFAPQLAGEALDMLVSATKDVAHQYMGEYPPGMPINQALGGFVNLEDVPGKRRKGSMMWSGLVNGHWWIDRQTGIAGVLITTVLPFGDAVVTKLYNDLEVALYRGVSD